MLVSQDAQLKCGVSSVMGWKQRDRVQLEKRARGRTGTNVDYSFSVT